MKKTTKQKLARYITPFMYKILTTFTFVLLTVAFSSSFANTDTTTISNFYQLKLEVEKLKFIQAQHKPNNYTPQIQALENQLNQLKNNFNANNFDVNRQFTHSKELIIRQDERIVDFNSHLFWSGILVTALLVLISVGGIFFSYKKAEKEIKIWLKEPDTITLFEPTVNGLVKKWLKEPGTITLFTPTVNGLVKKWLKEKDAQIQKMADQQKGKLDSFISNLSNPTEKEQKDVERQAEKIGGTNEQSDSQDNFDNLFTLHLNSYHEGNPEKSLEYINKALEIRSIKPKQEAKALVNKGTILGKSDKSGERDEAIETYDLIIKKFKDSAEITLLEKVAIALVDKGVILGKLDRLDEAIKTFNLVDEQFKDSTETTLLEKVAIALVNKGVVLSMRKRSDDAMEAFSLVIKRFEGRKEITFLENVAKAFVNKGIALSMRGRSDKAIETYDLIIRRFEGRKETTLLEQVAEAKENKRVLERKQNL